MREYGFLKAHLQVLGQVVYELTFFQRQWSCSMQSNIKMNVKYERQTHQLSDGLTEFGEDQTTSVNVQSDWM